jgi:NitT/TauT family transport system permease protein
MLRWLTIHAKISRTTAFLLSLLPFIIVALVYFTFSYLRLSENPDDKLMPSMGKMSESFIRLATQPDRRSEQLLLWADTLASLKRIFCGLGISGTSAFIIGVVMGMFPFFRALGVGFITFLSIIPPLALLPILFITFGVDELSKIVLIVIGTAPIITREIYEETARIPREQIVKALTLGATQLLLMFRVVIPQTLPILVQSLRVSVGPAWLFLIASEAIASTGGLGYRIFLVRRYLAMDIIIPYALWITLLGFIMDLFLRGVLRFCFPWYVAGRR